MTSGGRTKVTLIAPWAQRLGGAEQMLWGILRHLERDSLDTTVIFLEPGPFHDEVSTLGYRTAVLPATQLRDAANFISVVARLASLLRREQPDVILSWMAKAHLYAAPAAMLSGTGRRCIWWQHMIPERHWMDRIATALPAKAVGASSSASAQAQEKLWPRRRTFVVTPGVDVGRFESTSRTREAVREACGLPPATFVAVIVGRLQPWKGQQILLQAVAELREAGVDAGALVVGGEAFGESAGYERALHKQAHDLGLERCVHFTGHVEDPAPYLHAGDVCVNASDGEPFGIVLLEAMAAGLPVIAVDRAGPREIVQSGTTGMLIRHATAEELRSALKQLAGDPTGAKRMGAAARVAVAERFSVGRMADNFAAAIRAL